MILELNGIDVDCIIGERADERNRLQNLRVDVRLDICENAAESDELSETVDYAALTESIRFALVDAKCKMIERAARVSCEVCLANPAVRSATVRFRRFLCRTFRREWQCQPVRTRKGGVECLNPTAKACSPSKCAHRATETTYPAQSE